MASTEHGIHNGGIFTKHGVWVDVAIEEVSENIHRLRFKGETNPEVLDILHHTPKGEVKGFQEMIQDTEYLWSKHITDISEG
jgi:hypothetical protein